MNIMERKVSLSLFVFQSQFGDRRALEIAKEIGVEAVDFSTGSSRFDIRNPESV